LPTQAFADLLAARRWATDLVHWYNHEHRHSGISFVTPEQRHNSQDEHILRQRRHVFEAAKAKNPNRWSGPTRSWPYRQSVHLNPDSTPQHENLTT
jgi:putative transposase